MCVCVCVCVVQGFHVEGSVVCVQFGGTLDAYGIRTYVYVASHLCCEGHLP